MKTVGMWFKASDVANSQSYARAAECFLAEACTDVYPVVGSQGFIIYVSHSTTDPVVFEKGSSRYQAFIDLMGKLGVV